MNNNTETEQLDDQSQLLEESQNEMCRLLAQISDEKLIKAFFECLFTPSERVDFAKRWTLVKELDKGTTQRQIAAMLNMSLCKITRGSKELKKPDSAFRTFLNMLD